MKNHTHSSNFLFVSTLILLAAFSRVIPHIPNFSPLGAIALFGAAHFARKEWAFIVPLLATWLSDLFINNVIYASYYPEFTWFYDGFYWQYGSYILIALAGLLILRKVNFPRIVGGVATSTLIFFIVTNFGCWLGSTLYPQNMQGLAACYIAGIPFIKGTLLGDAFYSAILFGSYYFAQQRGWVAKKA